MTTHGKRADMLVHEQDPFNAESAASALAEADLTALDVFYVRSHGPVPVPEPAAWRLGVDGLVERELELNLGQLRARFQAQEIIATLQCAGNRRKGMIAVRDIPGETPWGPGATGTANWRGVHLADVLEEAGIKAEAEYIAFRGADTSQEADPPQHFGASIPRHKALAPEVLLAWEMNGQPLAPVHGAPLRVVVPGYIGARSVKWLQQITAQAQPSENYFQAQTYRLLPADADPETLPSGAGIALGAVAVNADILQPEDGASVAAGVIQVSGYAFAGDDRRIVRVDTSTDGGRSWQQAELLGDLGPWAWRHWRTQLMLEPGPADIVARAWDSSAATQPENPAHLWNPKGYINNAWARINLTVRP